MENSYDIIGTRTRDIPAFIMTIRALKIQRNSGFVILCFCVLWKMYLVKDHYEPLHKTPFSIRTFVTNLRNLKTCMCVGKRSSTIYSQDFSSEWQWVIWYGLTHWQHSCYPLEVEWVGCSAFVNVILTQNLQWIPPGNLSIIEDSSLLWCDDVSLSISQHLERM